LDSPAETGPSSRGPGALFAWLVVAMNAIGSIWVFVIMILVVADVAGRYVFNAPISGVPLVITMSLIGIAFMQLPDALRNNRLTRNEALLGPLLAHRPRAGHALQALFHLAGALLMALLVVYVAPMFEKAWATDSFLGARGDFIMPEWPFKLVIVVGAVVTGIQFLILAWRDLRAMSTAPR
jgi:TRAP-type mannitol/chloroaromatic compound transport system permease small subunit